MTITSKITLSERHLKFAEQLVEDGSYPSISSVVEAGMETMMDRETTFLPPGTMDEIARRLELPQDQWPEWDKEKLSESVKARLAEKYKS